MASQIALRPREGERRTRLSARNSASTPTVSIAARRIAERFGISPHHAAVVASLAGLGPQEAR